MKRILSIAAGLGFCVLSAVSASGVTIAHRYSFETDASDSVGGVNGILVGDASVSGGKLVLDGDGDLMEFEDLIDIGVNFGDTGVTVETWYTDNNSGQWAKLFTFGDASVGVELAYTHRRDNETVAGVDRNGAWTFDRPSLDEQHHLVISVTADGSLNTWVDGGQVLEDIATNELFNVVGTQEYLGESAWADPEHTGSIDEFRIWSGVMTPEEVALSGSKGTGELIPEGNPDGDFDGLPDSWEQSNFGDLDQTGEGDPDDDGLNNTGELKAGSDPNEADADGDGLKDGDEIANSTDPNDADTDGDGVGDGDEIANGTDPTTPNFGDFPLAIAHRYSFDADAMDSAGDAHGILMGDAMVAGGKLVLDGDGDYMTFSDPIDIGGNFAATGVTVESWYTDDNTGQWGKLFSFGTNAMGLELAYTHGRDPTDLAGVDRNGAFTFQRPTTGEQHHIAITVAGDGTLNTWVDGLEELIDVETNLLSNVTTTHEYLGESAWTADPEHAGMVDEFRIWTSTMTSDDVAASLALGPDALITDSGGIFQITSIVYDAGAGEVTLEWNSRPNAVYAVDAGENLALWTELDDAVLSGGETTTYVEKAIPEGTRTRYYRVKEIGP